MKKYRLIDNKDYPMGVKIYQIQALRDFTTINGMEVKTGDLGGFIRCEHNLSHKGDCWVANEAEVYDDVVITDNALIGDQACLVGKVVVEGNAHIGERARVGGWNTVISDNVKILGDAEIGLEKWGKIEVKGNVKISDYATIQGDCYFCGDVQISGNTFIKGGDIWIKNNVKICDVYMEGKHRIDNNVQIIGPNVSIRGGIDFEENARIINSDSKNMIEIGGTGCIKGNAFIQSQNDLLQIHIFSRFMNNLIAYKTENGFEILYNNKSFSPERIRKALESYEEYENAIQLAKLHILGGL